MKTRPGQAGSAKRYSRSDKHWECSPHLQQLSGSSNSAEGAGLTDSGSRRRRQDGPRKASTEAGVYVLSRLLG